MDKYKKKKLTQFLHNKYNTHSRPGHKYNLSGVKTQLCMKKNNNNR